MDYKRFLLKKPFILRLAKKHFVAERSINKLQYLKRLIIHCTLNKIRPLRKPLYSQLQVINCCN